MPPVLHTDNVREEIAVEIGVFAQWIISGLLDGIYLIIWIVVQWLVGQVIANLQLSGIDLWMLSAFQLLFAISTLAPIVVYIYTDIRIMLIRSQKRIRHEESKLSEPHDHSKA